MLSRLISPGDGRRCRLPVFLLAFVVLVGACDTEPARVDPASPTATETTELAVAQDKALDPNRFMAIEHIFARIWNRVPTFSGFWYDDLGRLVIGVTDVSDAEEVEAVLEQNAPNYFLDHRGARRSTKAVTAAYDFKTMIEWKHQARSHFGLLGLHSLDYAEDQNEIVAQVRSDAQRTEVSEALRDIGIPDGHLTVKIGDTALPTATINDRVRPVVGGIRIERSATDYCTLGFNAVLDDGDGPVEGFVTNSHCTETPLALDGGNWYQNTAGLSGDLIGAEHKDPSEFFGGACTHGSGCRWADVAFMAFEDGFEEGYTSGVDDTWARAIANIDENASSCEPTNGANEKTIDSSQPRLRIFAATNSSFGSWADPPADGETVYHLGVSTGETKAPVSETNTDKYSSFSGVWWLDQTISRCDTCAGGTHIASPGDSGGPVYRLGLHPCTDPIRLDGIRWATNAEDGNTRIDDGQIEVWFSPIDNIKADLAPQAGDTLDIRYPYGS